MATEGNAEHVGLHPSVSTAASRNTSHDVIDLTDSPPQVVDREGTTEVGKVSPTTHTHSSLYSGQPAKLCVPHS